MLQSMTGFGEAHSQQDGLAVAVEIRTINNRYRGGSRRFTPILKSSLIRVHLRNLRSTPFASFA